MYLIEGWVGCIIIVSGTICFVHPLYLSLSLRSGGLVWFGWVGLGWVSVKLHCFCL